MKRRLAMPKHRSSRKAVALVDALTKVYKANANASIALGQKKYLREQFEFWGLRQPTRKLVQRSVFLKHPITKTADLCSAIELLWDKEQREFQLAAIDLALSNRKLWTPDLLTSTFEFMIRNKSWWDTVDAIASSLVGPLVKSQLELGQEEEDEDEDEEGEEEAVKEEREEEEGTEGKQKEKEEERGELPAEEHGEEEREEKKEGQYRSVLDVLDRWNEDENLWIRRTSIIYQLKYKHDTDTQRLFRYCKNRMHEEDFFIRKAIGWALREYSKSNPALVHQFIEEHQHELSPLSKKEGGKHLPKLLRQLRSFTN